jgi:hypothetical protein
VVRLRHSGATALLALLYVLVTAPLALAAEPVVVDDLRFGGPDYDQLAGVAVLADGSTVAVGSTFVAASSGFKGWVVKLAPDRALEWQLIFLEHRRSRLRAVAALPDGDILVAGTYWAEGAPTSLVFVARIAPDATLRWAKAWGGQGDDEGYGLVVTPDGRGTVVGSTTLDGATGPVGWALRFDGNGNRLWETTFDAEVVQAAAVLSDGDLALAGSARTPGQAADLWVARLDGDGKLRWQARFGGEAPDSASTVAATGDNGLVVGGETLSQGAGSADAWLLRLDPEGGRLWQRTVGGPAIDRINAVTLLDDGTIAAAGTATDGATGNVDLWVGLFADDGTPVASGTVGGDRDDRGLGIAAAGAGAFVVTGIAQPEDADGLVADGRILFYRVP